MATCVGSIAYILWMSFVPPSGMPISKETTRLIGPALSDAEDQESITKFYEQWQAVIRKSRGLPVDVEPHRWFELRKSGPAFNKTENYEPDEYEKLVVTPFTEAEAPEYAALIKQNQQWYERVLATEPPPDASTWLDVDARPLIDSFRFQAMYQVGSGDIDGASESFQLLDRLVKNKLAWADHEGDVLRCAHLGVLTMQSLRSAVLATNDPRLEKLAVETSRPVELARLLSKALDESARYEGLAWYSHPQSLNRRFRMQSRFSQERIKANWFAHRIDWQEYARFHHAYYDGFVKAHAVEDDAERYAAMTRFWKETRKQLGGSTASAANWLDVATRDATRILKFKLIGPSPPTLLTGDIIVRDHNERRLTRLTVYLSRFKKQHDRFPKSLDELEPMIAEGHKEALCESFSGKRWPYEQTDAGFVVNKDSILLRVEWPMPR